MAFFAETQTGRLKTPQLQENKPDQKIDDDVVYRKKYITLKRMCEQIQLDNEKCLNRLYYVKKAASRMSRERRFLMSKLDKHRDDYKNATLTLPIEDDSVLQLMTMSSPIAPRFPASRGLAGLVTKTQRRKPANPGTRRVGRPRLISEMTPRDDVGGRRLTACRGGKRKRPHMQSKQDKEKDPLLPKKPANAFLQFCQSERHLMLGESSLKDPDRGDMTHQEMTRQLAKKWNYLESDKKETYYTMYEHDKTRYHKEMKHYIQSGTSELKPTADNGKQPPSDGVNPATTTSMTVKTEAEDTDKLTSLVKEPVPTAMMTNTAVDRVRKPEILTHVKKEPSSPSVVRESTTFRPKLNLQKPAALGDDPYDFDDD